MDDKARKELKEAQKIIKDGGFNLVCSDPEATLAVMRVFNAIKKDGDTERLKPVLWCEKYRLFCSDVIDCKYKVESGINDR